MNKPARFALWLLLKTGVVIMGISALATLAFASEGHTLGALISALPGMIAGGVVLYKGLPGFCRDVWKAFEEYENRHK